MPKYLYQSLFLEAKRFYKTIGSLPCKALNNEHILFSRNGFEHLIRKDRKIRPIDDQIRRFKLLKYIRTTMNQSTIIDYREIIKRKPFRTHKENIERQTVLRQWTLRNRIMNKTIKVVVQQEGLGKKHFLSIM